MMTNEPLIPITRRQALLFAVFLVVFQFATYISNDMIMPAMIAVTQSFHVSANQLPTAMTAFILGGACWQLILGPISDRFGRRPVMLWGAVLFVVCSIGITFAQSMDQFILGRFLQGSGLCFVFVIGYAALQEIFSERHAIQLIALMANVALIAPLIGPIAGAWYIHYASWPGIFWMIASIALVGLLGLWRYMPETVGITRRDGSVTKPEPLKLSQMARNYSHLCTDKTFMLGIFAMALLSMPLLIWIALAPLILIDYAGLSTIQYGWLQIPVIGAVIVGNFVLHYLANKVALSKIVFLSSIFVVLGLLLGFFWVNIQDGYFLGLVVGTSLCSLGIGMANGVIYRQTLFANQTSKGTVSAMISILTMLMFSLAVEVSKQVYATANNRHVALFLLLIGAAYAVIVWRFQVGLRKTDRVREPRIAET